MAKIIFFNDLKKAQKTTTIKLQNKWAKRYQWSFILNLIQFIILMFLLLNK